MNYAQNSNYITLVVDEQLFPILLYILGYHKMYLCGSKYDKMKGLGWNIRFCHPCEVCALMMRSCSEQCMCIRIKGVDFTVLLRQDSVCYFCCDVTLSGFFVVIFVLIP